MEKSNTACLLCAYHLHICYFLHNSHLMRKLGLNAHFYIETLGKASQSFLVPTTQHTSEECTDPRHLACFNVLQGTRTQKNSNLEYGNQEQERAGSMFRDPSGSLPGRAAFP